MSNDNFDDIDGIFEHATVEDFMRSTSAVTEVGRVNRGQEAFNEFVEEQLRAIRMAWIASETYMQPVALVANAKHQRVFIPDEDESLGDFVNRLHREAVAMEATWTFVAKRTLVADLGPGGDEEEDLPDVTDQEELDRAIAEGIMKLGVVWYAERREGRSRTVRHGQMADDNGTLGELIEGNARQSIPLFEGILNG